MGQRWTIDADQKRQASPTFAERLELMPGLVVCFLPVVQYTYQILPHPQGYE
jgi:hypothetical protein